MNAPLVMGTRCTACGNATQAFLAAPDYNRHLAPGEFEYVRCGTCGYIELVNPPPDLSQAYPQDYYIIPDSVETLASWAPHEQYKLDLLLQQVQGGRLLEIGPGNGTFAFLAQRAGFDVHAIEMDERCAAFLEGMLRIPTTRSADEAQAMAGLGSFDAICMWQVIEHLRDPFAMLAAAARALRPGGALILATPNPAAMQFRLLGRHWVHLDAPRHVCLIPIALMREKAQALGFRVALCTTTDAGSLSWNTFGWEYSLQTYVRAQWMRRVAARAGRVVAAITAATERQGIAGTAYTMALIKADDAPSSRAPA